MATTTTSQGALAQKDILSWASKDGAFKRLPSSFRSSIGDDAFPAEKGRYHLYVSQACPWAHRTLITRRIKGLQDIISFDVVHPFMGTQGWSFEPPLNEDGSKGSDNIAGVTGDSLYGSTHVRELYFKANKDYEGRFTVPILWDKKTETIVNNESSEIIRMLNTQFNSLLPKEYAEIDIYPESLRKDIEEMNSWVYDNVNNGVYKSGFATSAIHYEAAVKILFDSLDKLETHLINSKTPFLFGPKITEADIRLFPTIIRFDPVYVSHFKCNINTIRHGYPAINKWMKNLYWSKNFNGAFETDFVQVKHHYFCSHPQINPTRIVPVGPIPNIEK